MKKSTDSLNSFELADWLSRAEQADAEFNKVDSSWQTNDNIWKKIARKYGLSEDMQEFYLQFNAKRFPENLFDIPSIGEEDLQKYVSQREIKENVLQFYKLQKSWNNFLLKYSPLIGKGELEKLWHIFWGDPDVKKIWGLGQVNALRRNPLTKKEILSLVKKFGMQDFGIYGLILSDTTFMNEIKEIRERVSRTVSRRSSFSRKKQAY